MGLGPTSSQHGRYAEIAGRIRDELRFFSSSACLARHRDEWPQLWEALDDLVALVDRADPRHPTARLFDACEIGRGVTGDLFNGQFRTRRASKPESNRDPACSR